MERVEFLHSSVKFESHLGTMAQWVEWTDLILKEPEHVKILQEAKVYEAMKLWQNLSGKRIEPDMMTLASTWCATTHTFTVAWGN